MKNHEESAFKALTDAIDNGGKLRMSVPADPERDTDLLISRALNELRELSSLVDRVRAVLDGSVYSVRPPSTVRVNEALNLITSYEENNK